MILTKIIVRSTIHNIEQDIHPNRMNIPTMKYGFIERESNHMAKAKTPVIPIEELTTEEKIEKAEQYVTMADNMLMYQWRNKYYGKAMKILKPLFTEVPETRARHKQIRIKRSTVLAEGYIADYQEACRLRDEAKNEDQTRIAIQHFETLAEYADGHPVRTHLIDPELVKRLEECSDAAEQAKLTKEKMNKKRSARVTRNIVILVLLAALCVGGLIFKKTPSFHYVVGRVQSMMGDQTRAWARYKNAYLQSGREDWHQLYLDTRYQDGVTAYESGDYNTAYSDFKLLASEDHYLDSEAYFAKTEQKLLTDALVGDTVKFGNGIEWYVLDRKDSRLLLIKKSSCPDQSFPTDGNWENSTARSWLNETYLKETFTEAEMEAIVPVEVETSVNAKYGTDSGEATTDRMYILSMEEFRKYHWILKDTQKLWWLRTPGAAEGTMSVVNPERQVLDYGYDASEATIHLRPVMWVETKTE